MSSADIIQARLWDLLWAEDDANKIYAYWRQHKDNIDLNFAPERRDIRSYVGYYPGKVSILWMLARKSHGNPWLLLKVLKGLDAEKLATLDLDAKPDAGCQQDTTVLLILCELICKKYSGIANYDFMKNYPHKYLTQLVKILRLQSENKGCMRDELQFNVNAVRKQGPSVFWYILQLQHQGYEHDLAEGRIDNSDKIPLGMSAAMQMLPDVDNMKYNLCREFAFLINGADFSYMPAGKPSVAESWDKTPLLPEDALSIEQQAMLAVVRAKKIEKRGIFALFDSEPSSYIAGTSSIVTMQKPPVPTL